MNRNDLTGGAGGPTTEATHGRAPGRASDS